MTIVPSEHVLAQIRRRLDELRQAKGSDITILDVGGGVNPLCDATHVIDQCNYQDYLTNYRETRRYSADGALGGTTIAVTPQNWVVADITRQSTWPFSDKCFDFCFCNHTLEDVTDPFVVIEQMSRVAKEGYIGTPSKMWECTRGVEGRWRSRNFAGHSHHRWMFASDGEKLFIERKWHFIHGSSRWSFPGRYKRKWLALGIEDMSHFWKDSIKAAEVKYVNQPDLDAKQEAFVLRYRPANPASMIDNLAAPYLNLLRRTRAILHPSSDG